MNINELASRYNVVKGVKDFTELSIISKESDKEGVIYSSGFVIVSDSDGITTGVGRYRTEKIDYEDYNDHNSLLGETIQDFFTEYHNLGVSFDGVFNGKIFDYDDLIVIIEIII